MRGPRSHLMRLTPNLLLALIPTLQAAFMTFAFGGTNHYSGKDMVAAHKNIIPHLEESHFNAIVEHFVATLKDMEVPQEDIDAAVAVVATTKEAVLS